MKLIFFVIASILGNIVLASDYVHQGSIGIVESKQEDLQYVPMKKWVGMKFILLPQTKSQQSQYSWLYADYDFEYSIPILGQNLDYKKYVGRIMKVTELILSDPEDPDSSVKCIKGVMDDDDSEIIADVLGDEVFEIAPLEDIDSARKKYLNKTLWYCGSSLYTYNEETGERGTVNIKRYSPVKVVNVVASCFNSQPVRFILRTGSGKTGFVDVNWSGTNSSKIDRKIYKFERRFMVKDPRTIHKWSKKIWSAIENGTIFTGMTMEQVKMAMREPDSVNKDFINGSVTQQWVYRSGKYTVYLYFNDGILTSFQESDYK